VTAISAPLRLPDFATTDGTHGPRWRRLRCQMLATDRPHAPAHDSNPWQKACMLPIARISAPDNPGSGCLLGRQNLIGTSVARAHGLLASRPALPDWPGRDPMAQPRGSCHASASRPALAHAQIGPHRTADIAPRPTVRPSRASTNHLPRMASAPHGQVTRITPGGHAVARALHLASAELRRVLLTTRCPGRRSPGRLAPVRDCIEDRDRPRK